MKLIKFFTFFPFCFVPCAFPSVIVTYDAPGVQTTNVAGTSVYSFNTIAPNSTVTPATAFATFSKLYVMNANEYGGAMGGRYGVVGDPTGSANVQSTTVTFARPASYMGFWWSAADPHNLFTLYSGSTALLTMSNRTLNKALGSCGGANAYCGNPVNGQDPGELFAYVNIWGKNGTNFTSARFQQLEDQGGFEFDNVAVPDAPIGGAPSIPEPGTWGFAGLGLVLLVGLQRTLRRA